MKNITLRDHQKECVEEVLKHNKGKVILPTGTGKTVIQAEIIYRTIKEYIEKGIYGHIVVRSPRILLAWQLIEEVGDRLSEHHLDVNYINVNSGEFDSNEFEMMMVKSGINSNQVITTTNSAEVLLELQKSKEQKRFAVIITTYHSADVVNSIYGLPLSVPMDIPVLATNDEAQYLSDNGAFHPIASYPANKTLFFTATPKSSDDVLNGQGMGNEKIFGKVIFRKSPKEMIEKGEMTKPAVHTIDIFGKDDSDDYSYNYKNMMNCVISSFDKHKVVIARLSADKSKIGAKMVVVCEGQRALIGMLETQEFKDFRENNPHIKMFAMSSDYGIMLNGVYYKAPIGNYHKNKFLKMTREMGNNEEAIIFHVDMISEGIDVPGITAVLPFRNLGKTKFLQNIGRGTRLHKEDRDNLYNGRVRPCSFGHYIKPYTWIILPRFMDNSEDFIARYEDILRGFRDNYEFDSSEIITIHDKNGMIEEDGIDNIGDKKDKVRGTGNIVRDFIHSIEDMESLNRIAEVFFKNNVLDYEDKKNIITEMFKDGNALSEP